MNSYKFDKSYTLFLDRDGVINDRIMGAYITKWEDFHFLPGVIEAIQIFNKIFARTIIVTNQAGVGKGLMKESDLVEIHQNLMQELKLNATYVDAIYSCTKLATDPTNTRKPNPSMAHKASSDFPDIDLSKSIMVGDTASDMNFGRNFGAVTVLIEHDTDEQKGIDPALVDMRFNSLLEFAKSIDNG